MAARRRCSSGVSRVITPFALRVTRSWRRTAARAASVFEPDCASKGAELALSNPANARIETDVIHTLLRSERFITTTNLPFDDFKARNDFCGRPQCCRHATVFFFRELYSLLDGLLGNVTAGDNMMHFHALVAARMLIAALASYLNPVGRNVLPLFPQDRNDVDTGARAQGDEQEFHWGRS